MALRRGFKAEAERLATDIWGGMGLKPGDPLDALTLAKHVGCDVRSAAQIVDIAKLKELQRIQDDAVLRLHVQASGRTPRHRLQPIDGRYEN